MLAVKNLGKFGKLQAIRHQSFLPIFTAFNRIVHGFTLPMAKHMASSSW